MRDLNHSLICLTIKSFFKIDGPSFRDESMYLFIVLIIEGVHVSMELTDSLKGSL